MLVSLAMLVFFPVVCKVFMLKCPVWSFLPGTLGFLSFLVIFVIEMIQDHGKTPFYEKTLKEDISFDPDLQYPVILSSICTGEKVAGFRNRTDRSFTEVMLIRSEDDRKRFMELYGLDSVKTEY